LEKAAPARRDEGQATAGRADRADGADPGKSPEPPEPPEPEISPPSSRASALRELAMLFARLGCTAFGGPAAHIAMMEEEVVRRRRWIKRADFLDLLGATNLIPGPSSTELAIHIGHRRAGLPGLLVAGSCFILPAAFVTGAIAWAYVRYGSLPQAEALLYGVKPVIIAVVLQALWSLSRTAVKTKALALVAALCVAARVLGAHELLVLFGAGAVIAISRGVSGPTAAATVTATATATGAAAATATTSATSALTATATATATAALTATAAAAAAPAPFALAPLFLFFIKVGSVLFGSGYVLLAFLRADLVERLRWMTEAQLLDAIAVGQVTPGPVFTTATFIGYVLGGAPGALVATLGIFLPAFFFVAVSGPLIPRLRRSKTAGAFLDGVNVASLALMAIVTAEIARAAIVDWITVALVAASALLLIRYKVSSAWLVLGGGAIGVGAQLLLLH
jgi:chromate transporter